MENAKNYHWAIRDRREFDNTYHPGLNATDLRHEVYGVPVFTPEDYPKVPDNETLRSTLGSRVLCHNCGWNDYHESDSRYTSRLKVLNAQRNSGIWELGSGGPWLLKDYPNYPESPMKMDFITQEFLRKRIPSLPILESYKFDGPETKFSFVVMARAKGSRLASLLDSLSAKDKDDIFQDLARHMKQWRQLTSPKMCAVDGSEIYDNVVAYTCYGSISCIKTGSNEEEWLENLTPAIRKGLLEWKYVNWRVSGKTITEVNLDSWIKQTEERIAQLKASFPRGGGPYVFTHGDLKSENIFVSNDNEEKKWKVSALIGWDHAGFYPWWSEALSQGHKSEIMRHVGGYADDDLQKIKKTLELIEKDWSYGSSMSTHGTVEHGGGLENVYLRKPFCECQPYQQKFVETYRGAHNDKHHDNFKVVADPEGDKYLDKFELIKKEFEQWFMEFSAKDSASDASEA